MADVDNNSTFNKAFPVLDPTNFQQWFFPIKTFLKHKNLLKYCLKGIETAILNGAALNNVRANNTETCLILMNHLSRFTEHRVPTADYGSNIQCILLVESYTPLSKNGVNDQKCF